MRKHSISQLELKLCISDALYPGDLWRTCAQDRWKLPQYRRKFDAANMEERRMLDQRSGEVGCYVDCAMVSSKIPLQDPLTGRATDVISDNHVLWSSGDKWQGITVEVYEHQVIETAEFRTVHHNIVLYLSDPARIELKADGIRDDRRRVSGDLSFFPAGTVCHVGSREAHQVLVASVTQQLMNHLGPPLELAPQTFLKDSRIEHICRALKAEAESSFSCGPLYGESLGLALAGCLHGDTAHASSRSHLIGGLAPQAYKRVVDFIDSDLAGPLHLQSLAELAGLSQFRFAHNFKVQTGLSPHQFVMRARLQRAMQLLRETDAPITEIALAVGFQGSSRFNALFKRELGETPSEYRRLFREVSRTQRFSGK